MTPVMSMTPEQRMENLEKARVARKEKQDNWKAGAYLLKTDFADSAHWQKLASKFKVRMPSAYVPGSELKVIRKAARTLGLTTEELNERIGGIAEFQKLNPTYPAYALIGFLLEIAEEKTL